MADDALENQLPDIDVQTPDIPMPPEVQPDLGEVKDAVDGAFKFAFIGSGQGGSRISQAMYKLGYRRVCAVNTAEQDLATVDLPRPNKLCIGGGGAGKDPVAAKNMFEAQRENLLDFMRRSFGTLFDRIFVTVGAGGGTGAGTAGTLISVASELQETLKCKSTKVGVIVALPKASEGQRVNQNAAQVLQDLLTKVEEGKVSPLIIIDNEKINDIYPNLPVDVFWLTANSSVCSLFHLFNNICVKQSRYSTFDAADYQTILDSGLIVFGATRVAKWQDATDISFAVRENLRRNILSGGVDLATGKVAGAVIIGGQNVLSEIPQTHLDHGFDQLTRTLAAGSTVHRGIYRGDKETLAIYTTIGGLARPTQKLEELKKLAGI